MGSFAAYLLFLLTLLGLMRTQGSLSLLELKDDIFEVAVKHARQIRARVADTVVSHAVLREVVCADFFRAVA